MATPNSLALHRAVGQLLAEVERDTNLAGEIARARREFLGVDAGDLDPLRQAAAEARFAEWYLLERESEVLGEVPIDHLARVMSAAGDDLELLQSSVVGVFLVERGGSALRLRDLQDERLYDVDRPEMLELSKGDMLIGRLFVDEDGACVPSAAVATQAGAEGIARAFRSDLASLDPGRRLSQAEIEHLLFRRLRAAALDREAAVPVAELEDRLRKLLLASGTSEGFVANLLRALERPGQPGNVMGPALDELAFHTDVDLEAARRLIMEIWNAHRVEAGPAPPAPPAASDEPSSMSLGQQIARRIEDGLENREDVEKLFEDVAEMFGEEIFDEDDDDAERRTEIEGAEPSPAWRGDLEPLIQEFLWEEDCADGPEAVVLARLREQQDEAPVPKLDLEYLEASDLLRLLLRAYLESPPDQRESRVRDIYRVLERFYAWAERTQEYAVAPVLSECREVLVDELARLHRASLQLSTESAPGADARPSLVRVTHVDPEGFEIVPTAEGDPMSVAEPAAAEHLREGDLILGIPRVVDDGSATLDGMVVVLPAGAEVLMG